jgi:WD40 repeat protein
MALGMPPRVLDTVTGAEIAVLQGIDSPVMQGSISPDGRWAATAHENLTAYLWDVSTGESTEILQITEEIRGELRMEPRSGPTFPASWSFAFSPDSTLLAVRNNGAEVADRALVRDLLSGERYNLPENTQFDTPIFAVDNLAVLRLRTDNGNERVAWEPRTNTLPPKSMFELVPSHASLSDDGRLMARVGYNQIEVYEVASEALIAEIALPENLLGVALRGFSANNTYFAYNVYFGETDPGTDYIWDVARSEFAAPKDVTDVWFQQRSPAYGAVTERIAEQSALMLYPSDATPDTPPIARLGGGAAWALFFPDESHVLAVYPDGVIVVWQLD